MIQQPFECKRCCEAAAKAECSLCICSAKVLSFIAFLFAAALGLILGAVFAATLLTALPALIILAVILAVMIIGILIFRYCSCCRSRRCC